MSSQNGRFNPVRIEKVIHKLCVVLTNAETKRATLVDIQQNLVHFLQNQVGSDVVSGKDVIQLRFIVAAIAPFQNAQIH